MGLAERDTTTAGGGLTPPSAKEAAEATEAMDGVSVRFQPAGHGRRLMALMVDWGAISAAMTLVVYALFAVLTPVGITLSRVMEKEALSIGVFLVVLTVTLASLLGTHAYFVHFESRSGATPGKKLFGLRVIGADGSKPEFKQCLTREIFRYVDSLLVPAMISMILSPRNQRLGDLAAGTMVTYSREREESESFVYVAREDYLMLANLFQPRPPDSAVVEFLGFANSVYLLGTVSATPEATAYWANYARAFLSSQAGNWDDPSVIRFYAEYCFQRENRRA